ncbi:hypothetical protein DENSPDRAFT_839487 [Dentipellis sp. KUC8613]|nr:hypothetical protein DENSPDRAFT_839487 [Dentipellis sp. KUC8613]
MTDMFTVCRPSRPGNATRPPWSPVLACECEGRMELLVWDIIPNERTHKQTPCLQVCLKVLCASPMALIGPPPDSPCGAAGADHSDLHSFCNMRASADGRQRCRHGWRWIISGTRPQRH